MKNLIKTIPSKINLEEDYKSMGQQTLEFCPERRGFSLSLKTNFYFSRGDIKVGAQELTLNNSVTLSIPGNGLTPKSLRKAADLLEKQIVLFSAESRGVILNDKYLDQSPKVV